MEYLEKPVFVCGHRKTGTTMAIGLFDGANDAVVYPDDSGLFYLYYPRYGTDSYSRKEKISRISEVIIGETLKEVIDRPLCTDEERRKLIERCSEFRSAKLSRIRLL